MNGEWLGISKGDFGDPPNFAIQVSSLGFNAIHPGIFLVCMESLSDDLDALLMGHADSLSIEGSEGFSLDLRRLATTYMVKVRLCKVVYMHDARTSFDQTLECAFESKAESIESFKRQLDTYILKSQAIGLR